MRGVIALTVALCSLTSVQQILAQDARSNIEKAVTAHGGEAKLASLRRVKFEMEVNITAPQDKTAPPRKALSVGIQGTVKGDAISVVVTLKNPEGEEVGVMATEGKGGMKLLPDSLPALGDYAGPFAELLDLPWLIKAKDAKLTPTAAAEVSGRPAVGVAVHSAGRPEMRLYFDRATGLLVRRVIETDEGGKKVVKEMVYSDYNDRAGLQVYRRFSMPRAGKVVFEGKLIKLEWAAE